jgi:predicted dehydrogenase
MSLKIGIVGTGWVVRAHIESLKKIEDVTIHAIAGRNLAKARELTAGTGATVYDHWQPMLEKEQLDAVFILLPPHLHGELEVACAEHVKGVLVEKPICADLATAQKASAAFEKARTIVSVGYMNRYRASVQKARALLANDHIVVVNGWWVGGMPGPLWWRTREQSGGQFVEQCTHLVDAARYIAGEITEVSATATRGFVTDVPDYSVDDAMVVNVRFVSGAIGNFTTACHAPGVDEIGLRFSSRSLQCSFSGWSLDLQIAQQNTPTQQHKSEEDIFLMQNRAFVRALKEINPSLIRSSYADAMQTLRVTLAANESARTGKSVRV